MKCRRAHAVAEDLDALAERRVKVGVDDNGRVAEPVRRLDVNDWPEGK